LTWRLKHRFVDPDVHVSKAIFEENGKLKMFRLATWKDDYIRLVDVAEPDGIRDDDVPF
jgi:hypothetical protein